MVIQVSDEGASPLQHANYIFVLLAALILLTRDVHTGEDGKDGEGLMPFCGYYPRRSK